MTWHHEINAKNAGKIFLIGMGLIAATAARADLAEEITQHATDSASTHLFTLNPAVLTPKGLQGGVLLVRESRESTLDHTDEGGDKVKSTVQDEHQAIGLLADLGAGAGIGVSHQISYYKAETDISSRGEAVAETKKMQHSSLKLLVELTDDLEAGIALRYLYRDVSIFGDPFAREQIRYKTTMVGYGSGFVYRFKTAAIAYTYFPPLRGKTEVEGEEMIVVEPGQIGLDAYVEAKKGLKVGLLAKRWVNEVDDLAGGTTSGDDDTEISLYGLDPDQYLFRRQLIMLGVDWDLTKAAGLKISAGQEQSELNFDDLFVYNRAGVRGRGSNEQLKSNRVRAMARFGDKGIEADVGFGLTERKHDFPDRMNGGSYEASAKELFAMIGMKL